MNIYSRGIRNAFRNGIRTVAIVGMLGLSIGLALAMLLAHQAIGQKIKSVQANIGNTISIAPVGIRGFQGGGTPLTADDLKNVKSIAHVTSVDESLSDRLTTDNTNLVSAIDAGSFGQRQFRIDRGQNPEGSGSGAGTQGQSSDGSTDGTTAPAVTSFKPPVTVIGTDNPLAAVNGTGESTATLKSGNAFDGSKDAEVALLGTTLATKNNLKVGSTFTAYGTTFTVSGIFDAGNTFSNNQVVMPLPTVQRLSTQTGDVTAATVHIDSAVNLDSTTTAVKNALGGKADVTNDADNAKATLSSLENIRNVSLFSLIGAAGTAAVIILLTMVMIVRERRREIGVLKAIGGSNLKVMLQFTVESVTLTVLAAAVGIIIGSLAATPVTKMLANNTDSSTATTARTFGGPNGGQVSISTNGGDASGSVGQDGTTRRFGGVAGAGGGIRNRLQNNSAVQSVKNLKANVGVSILLYGFGGAILIAAIGSTAAAGLIAKVRPAEVMRVE